MVFFPPAARRLLCVLISFIAFCTALASPTVFAAGWTIGAGGTSSINTGTMSLDCGDLVIEGTLNMNGGTLINVGNVIIESGGVLNNNSGSINLSGDWTNNGGSTNSGNNQVTFNTDCGVDTINISGDSSFWHLSLQTDSGRQVTFGAGSTTTVLGNLVMNGAGDENNPANLLKIRSSSPGTPANLLVSGPYAISRVDVRDNHAVSPGEWVNWGAPEDFDSIDSGGNFRWFHSGEGTAVYEAIPTLSEWGMAFMALLLLGMGLVSFRRYV